MKSSKYIAVVPGTAPTGVRVPATLKTLTWGHYLEFMVDRLEELAKEEKEYEGVEDPWKLYQREWWDRAGRDVAARNYREHVYHPEFHQMLADENRVDRDKFPIDVTAIPEEETDLSRLDDLGSLSGWLMEFLPSRSRD